MMTEIAMVEAVRSAQLAQQFQAAAPDKVADPDAVARFQAAMAPTEVQAIPFADQVAASWQVAQENHQGILHRVKALSELGAQHALSAAQLSELQYEVANLAFQQEVVAKVADKASTAVQTLVKNG